ncbi:putative pentatricopeptide repeat-containing protein [Drosera capensis]
MLEKKMEVKPVVYSTLIRCFFSLGRKDEVKRVLKEMKRNGCRPDTGTYNAFVTGYCRDEGFESALKVLGEMVKRKLKPYLTTCNTLLHGFCKGRKMKEAKSRSNWVGVGVVAAAAAAAVVQKGSYRAEFDPVGNLPASKFEHCQSCGGLGV